MNKKIVFFILMGILLLALGLRLWSLATVPPSPDWDEAALGYNAYSILHTGKDEYGKWFPVIFRSFDDYKPGLYIYLIIPFIKIFGLSLFATRLPAAIFGILSVLGTYLLVKKLFLHERYALLSAFFLAICPWHIQFTHAAFEASVGVTFNIFAVYFFLIGLEKPKYMFLSIFSAVLGIYVYQSEKVFIPLLFIGLISIYWKQLWSLPKKYLASFVIFGVILLLPLVSFTLSNNAVFARAAGVSILSDTNDILKNTSNRLIIDKSQKDYLGLIFDNRRLLFTKEVVANYFSHFDLNWLFITGDIERHHAPGMGLLYLWDLPFILLGIWNIVFGNYEKKTKLIIFSWFLLVPIPAAVTTGVPHAIRTINFLPLYSIFIAVGSIIAFRTITTWRNQIMRVIVYIIILLTFVFNMTYYLNQYFIQQNYFNSEFWQYGYASIVPDVQQLSSKYTKIVISNQPSMDQSYMFFLFYLQYPPKKYQEESQKVSGGFRENHTFSKYEFRPIIWSQEIKPKTLFIGRPSDFPSGVKKLKEVNYLNGKPAIDIVEG